MALYRRRLPHDYETDQPVFLTWRLPDSLPCHRAFPAATVNSGQAFAAMDRLLDEARSGPFYLRQPAIADMVVEAIQYNAANLEHYVLHAFVVMPNHVHLLATPALALPKLTKSLKGITSTVSSRRSRVISRGGIHAIFGAMRFEPANGGIHIGHGVGEVGFGSEAVIDAEPRKSGIGQGVEKGPGVGAAAPLVKAAAVNEDGRRKRSGTVGNVKVEQ